MSQAPPTTLNRHTFRRLGHAVVMFLRSDAGGRAKFLLAMLLVLMFGINGMNVLNSYVGRYFMSAIEQKDVGNFRWFGWCYLGVFLGSAAVGVLFRFTEERLGLLWREWLTRRIVTAYIDRGICLRAEGEGGVSNPDQRMSEDVRQLTTTTLSFFLMILNGTLTALSFSGVLWTISPKLFLVAVAYALAGSLLTIKLGRPLIRMNYQQADHEANFRAELIRLREEAPAIWRTGSQDAARASLLERIDLLCGNLRRIMSVNRNLNFFTSGYNYLIQLIPLVIVAPLFMRGDIEFGVIGQSAMAFATLLGAFSLVITQFQSISSYASVVMRLGEFVENAEKAAGPEAGNGSR